MFTLGHVGFAAKTPFLQFICTVVSSSTLPACNALRKHYTIKENHNVILLWIASRWVKYHTKPMGPSVRHHKRRMKLQPFIRSYIHVSLLNVKEKSM